MGEGWAYFTELGTLADRAYPILQEEARKHLSQPQIAFSVMQKQSATLDAAVVVTLETESYFQLSRPSDVNFCLQPVEQLPGAC